MVSGEENAHFGAQVDLPSIAVTGANGFVGRVLTSRASALGIKVIRLARRSSGKESDVRWQLGDPLPEAAARADAVIHLACATLTERTSFEEAVRLDLEGTRIIRDDVRRLHRMGRQTRLIFVSSQSAQLSSANAYGRSKWQIEALMETDYEIIVRPGLVYGDKAGSVAAMLERLARFPVVPTIRTQPSIQPIHVTELADGLLRIVALERPQRLYEVGAVQPMTFRQAIVATAKRLKKRPPATVTLPIPLIRLGARIADATLNLRPPLTERVDGLTALRPMATAASLAELGCRLLPYDVLPEADASSS